MTRIFWKLFSALLSVAALAVAAPAEDLPLDQALAMIHQGRQDLAIEADIKSRDQFRMERIRGFLLEPAEFTPFMQNLACRLASADSVSDPVRLAPSLLEIGSELDIVWPDPILLEGLALALAESGPPAQRQAWLDAGRALEAGARSLAPELAQSVCVLALAAARAQSELETLFPATWTQEDRARFMAYARDLARMDRGVENFVALDESWFARAAAPDQAAVFRACACLAAGIEAAAPLLARYVHGLSGPNPAAWEDTIARRPREPSAGPLLDVVTPAGRFLVGGPGDDTYAEGGIAFLVETGGDDQYLAPVASAEAGLAFAIDAAGDDLYQSEKPCAFGSGCAGVGLLFDLVGRDRYIAADHGLGVGIFGAGVLADVSGDDTYVIAVNGQGSGFFGLGLLLDLDGNDMYWAGMFAQGVGHPRGLGLLLDRAGHDTYTIGGAQRGWSASADYHMSGGQGFGCGIREYASGGYGLLVDLAGNDRYQAGASAQGAGYWYSVGSLADGAGNDVYQCIHYGQATAFHYALGLLWDAAGNDRYLGGCATQAGSWDGGVSVFIDSAGNDHYEAGSIANGAAAVTSVGIFLDHAGDDTYKNTDQNSMGSSRFDERRGWGGTGIFIDSGGCDTYASESFANNAFWFQGDRGVGVDEENSKPLWARPFRADGLFSLPAASPAPATSVARVPAPALGTNEAALLFRRYADWSTDKQGKARMLEQLKAMPETALPALSAALKSKPFYLSWDGAMTAFPQMGSKAIPVLTQLALDPDVDTRARAVDCLGRIPDQAVIPPLLTAAKDPAFPVRAAAAGALGAQRCAEAFELLTGLLKDAHGRVRVQAAAALAKVGAARAIEPLVAMLDDPLCAGREAAGRALGRLGAGAATAAKARFESGTARDRIALMLAAAGWLADQQQDQTALEDAVRMVVSGLADQDPAVRSAALDACEQLKSKDFPPAILDALQSAIKSERLPFLLRRLRQAAERAGRN